MMLDFNETPRRGGWTRVPTRRLAQLGAALGLLACLALLGCNSGPSLPPLVPVKGKVTVEGKPVTAGQVSYFPQAPDPQHPVGASSGQIDESGNYEIFTQGKAGAPKGKYKVTVTPSMVPTPGAKQAPNAGFNQKFQMEPRTTLVVEVKDGAPADAYDLKLTR